MKTAQLTLTALLGALLLSPIASQAEDIDIYTGLSASAGLPNVLIILDNAASFDATTPGCNYADGSGAASLSGKVAGTEQCALYNTIQSLPTNTDGSARVNIGFMFYSTTGIAAAYPASGCVSSNDGGCLVQALSPMTAAGKTALMNWIKGWDMGQIKANSQGNALAMEEAWAYYAGNTGPSGRSYAGIQPTSGCQKNFVIYIGNAYRNNTTPGDSKTPKEDLAAAPPIAGISTTPNPDTTTIVIPSGSYGLPPANNSCGTYTWKSTGHGDTSGLYADEWARYMYTTDIYGNATGNQNIVTYTIGALGPTCDPGYAALLTSMARYGGGKYFATDANNSASIAQAILKILNEVQAVNSVFASSSLPVSVNAQGTFLNQIYMGMFRPDANGLPRWVGNLKQYEFCYDTLAQTLTLCDSVGAAAISGAGTGFISPNAISFWTSQNKLVEPDLNGGFWRSKPQGAGGGYDLPDGELVEKGGAAQVARLSYLKEDYTAAAGTSANPRNMYTFCPSGSGCIASLTNSANALSATNSGIAASAFGASTITVNSIVRTGTTALVTTNTGHGFSTGDSVTIAGATQPEYDVTQNVTVNSATTFTITGLPDYPNTPSTGTYSASLPGLSPKAITGVSVATSTTANANGCTSGTIPNINCNQVTVTLPGHGYSNGDSINIQGVSPAAYSGTFVIGNVTANTFTYNVPVTPTSPSVNDYSAQLPPPAPIAITSINYANGSYKTTVTANNSFTSGQSITISGSSVAANNGTYTISSPTATTFKITGGGSSCSANCGTVVPNQAVISIAAGNISRASATATTATATGITASAFSNGQTVNLAYVSGTGTSESAYAPLSGTNSVAITCSGTCTSFTFPITTAPSTTLTTSSPTATKTGTPVTIPANAIQRSGTTATVTGVANTFISGQSIVVSVSGSAVGTESAYLSPAGGWTINCPVSCSTAFTFGPVALTPSTPATGTIRTYSGTAPPDKTSLVSWVRGQDNLCDEASPDTGCPNQTVINIRPSLHGDVLHSRPTVINYGGTIGVVVYYGANDGVFRAINGNQTNPAGSTMPAPGNELWSFVPTEFFGALTRLRDNSPVLRLSNTPAGITPAPRTKDYFIDGPSSVYQVIKADGTTQTANIYLSMRRGGRFIYALNVSSPNAPVFLWKIDPTNADFAELGQTWAQPKVAFVKGYCGGTACSTTNLPTPVMIFGAGYDPNAEDIEPPAADSMGRGIFIVDALTGNLVWKATYGAASACSGTVAKASCTVLGMDYSIPADITLMERSGNDGYIDRLYATDVGGNVWRVDLEPAAGNTPDKWRVTQLAALGCSTGACASGTTPRKFFYPADMVPTSGYDAVLVGSGDREHPLYTQLSYNVTNRFYMVKDPHPGNDGREPDGSYTIYTEANLKDITPVAPATTSTYDGTLNGYYITLGTGEKVVNAPLTVAGYTYFGTNTPATPSSNSCTTNLGTAKGYQVAPLTGKTRVTTYDGGGLPPSPVAGAVDIKVNGQDMVLPFCIGCGGSDPNCKSALCGSKPPIDISTSRNRTYWYKEID